MSAFKKATKAQAKLRISIFGPSGSGKTYTSLLLAAALGGPVALIDTERGSASKYAGDVADFDALELTSYEPAKYIRAIGEAAKERYPVLVIDSLSHAWSGKGGILEQKDAKGGRFDAWKELTPQQTDLLEAILQLFAQLFDIAADAITAAKVAADVTTELQSGLATSAALRSSRIRGNSTSRDFTPCCRSIAVARTSIDLRGPFSSTP